MARKRKSTKFLVGHVTATPSHMDIGLKEVTAMHKRRGWSDCGYRVIIRRNGDPEYAPGGLDLATNHVRGYNSVSLGISMVGGVDRQLKPENNMTDKQLYRLEKIMYELADRYPKAGICGHRDLSPDRDGDGIIEPHEHLKACPCFDIIPWAASKGLPVAPIRGVWSKGTVRPIRQPDSKALILQRKLVSLGFDIGPVDGIIGRRTKSAVRAHYKKTGEKLL